MLGWRSFQFTNWLFSTRKDNDAKPLRIRCVSRMNCLNCNFKYFGKLCNIFINAWVSIPITFARNHAHTSLYQRSLQQKKLLTRRTLQLLWINFKPKCVNIRMKDLSFAYNFLFLTMWFLNYPKFSVISEIFCHWLRTILIIWWHYHFRFTIMFTEL